MTVYSTSTPTPARPPLLPVLRCPDCDRKLLEGYLHGRIKCGRCGREVQRLDTPPQRE